jgi:hypothetical protein
VIKLKRSSQLIGQFGHVTASAVASNLKSTLLHAIPSLAVQVHRKEQLRYPLCSAKNHFSFFLRFLFLDSWFE